MATDLILIRHGEAFSNVENTLGGELSDKGLTERGFAQVQALAARLQREGFRADVLYASTLKRAQQTAEAVAAAIDLPIVFDDDLHELRPGDGDGMHISEVRERYPQIERFLTDVFTPIAPNGESWGYFQARVSATLERIVNAHQDQKIVIVSHGGVTEVSFLYFLALGPQTRSRNAFHVRNTGITRWRHSESFGRQEWHLATHNDDRHLDGIE